MNERLPFLQQKTLKLTISPGVYLMKDKDNNIIYIGKAKNLKNRVSSYFRHNSSHTVKVMQMVSNVYDYDFIVTDSEYEALVLLPPAVGDSKASCEDHNLPEAGSDN